MPITDQQRAELCKALSPNAIATRKAQEGGPDLSYLHGHYVMREMNRIFGNAGWGYRATVEKVHADTNEKGNFVCTYLGRCVLTVGDCVIEDVGAGQGNSRRPGEAIEKAAKEAATDALKRCCKTLGDPLGLALYDKEQAHVGDPEPMPLGNKARQLITAINVAEDAQAKKNVMASIEAAWQSLRAHEQEAIEEAIEARKRKARGEAP